jgi:hypothetical protein
MIYLLTTDAESTLFADAKKKNAPVIVSPDALKKGYACLDSGSLLYFDTAMGIKDFAAAVKKYTARTDLRYGILDAGGEIADPATYFHQGFADYIGASLAAAGASVKRVPSVEAFKPVTSAAPAIAPDSRWITAPNGWADIKDGKEYTFCMAYVELDKQNEVREYFRGPSFTQFRERFQNAIARKVEPAGGRVWMWSDYGGLILFPFDGAGCPAIDVFFRLYLNRVLFFAEELELEFLLSFHTAMILGTTQYQSRGNTGTIIADAVTSIHHLGQKYAPSETLSLSEELKPFIPSTLKSFFVPQGEYEGRKIIRMKRFV